MRKKVRTRAWIVTFVTMVVVVFVVVDYYTGYEAIGAATRLLWNGVAFVANAAVRMSSGLVSAMARVLGMRRLGRLAAAFAGVGLGYAGSVLLSDAKLHRARGWRGKLKAAVTIMRNKWDGLHLVWKLAIVAALIASQVYLHFLLIVFPIAFLVPVVRRVWLMVADDLVGYWYRTRLGRLHRAMVARMERTPGYRRVVEGGRLLRMRYLCAWRMWRYDERYRNPKTGGRSLSVIEPVRLLRRGELDRYVHRPLLRGSTPAADAAVSGSRSCPPPRPASETPTPEPPDTRPR